MAQEEKVLAIIQARMGSTRLPGKVLAQIAGHPMLWHVVNRVRMARSVHQVIVATSNSVSDQPIADFCIRQHMDCYRGSEEDVLERYFQCASQYGGSIIVRITADCPLLDPEIIDKVVGAYQNGPYDYVTNIFPRTYPEGLDVEVLSFSSLERARTEATDAYDREHVTPYLRRYSKQFRIGNVRQPEDLSEMHWSVDHPEDMQFVRAVYDHIKASPFGLAEVLGLLKECPELVQINKGTKM